MDRPVDGATGRCLEDFFTERGLALPTDHAEQLAAGRRLPRQSQ